MPNNQKDAAAGGNTSDNEQRATKPRICLHITKTAGGTLKDALRETPNLNVKFLYGQQDLDALSSSDLGDVDLVYGHSVYGVHSKLGLEPNYMCFLRHPITRTISHYFHLSNVDRGPIGDKIRESDSIDDFFSNHSHWEFSNFMCRVISGHGTSAKVSEDALLKDALRSIDEDFQFVGFQEFFPISMLRFGDIFGRRLNSKRDINVGRYDLSAISRRTIRTIGDLNGQDIRLYKYCLRKFL